MKTLTNFNTTLLNYINFKTIFSFIVLVCFTQTGFGQTTVTYDFSSSGAVTGLNETSPGISIDANIGFGSFKNSGTANPALTSGQLRLYQNATRGGSIKVYANNGVTITEVVVRASSVTGPAGYDADGVFQSNLTDGTTYTMSGLSATSTVEFFQRSSSSSNRIYVDEIEITYTSGGATPTCPDPASLAASGETATTVDLAWTAGGTESLWNIEVYEQGSDTSTATPVYTETGVNTNSTTATGLTFGGDYTAYVQADCGATDGVSDWIASNDFSLEYCESTPTSNDNDGISNVQLGTTDFPTGDVTYADYRDTVVDLELGNTANLQVTFETDFDYHTNVWIDFNDNLVFESTELVFVGESADLPITTLDASFDIAIDAAQGTHYMRIGTADMGQSTPNPCYDGTYGVTIDMAINIIIGGGCTALTTWDGTAWSNGVPDANSYAVISGAYSTGTDGAITACVMKADADVTIDGATDAAISEVLVETGNTLTIDETSSLTVSGDYQHRYSYPKLY